MYSNISQILQLYKMWWYYNKFDSMIGGMLLKSQNTTMRVYGAWIKTHYVLCSKHIAALALYYDWGLVRNKPLGVPASVKLVYYDHLEGLVLVHRCDLQITWHLCLQEWNLRKCLISSWHQIITPKTPTKSSVQSIDTSYLSMYGRFQ